MSLNEKWKRVHGWDRYEVSTFGRVKVLPYVKFGCNRNGTFSFITKQKILKSSLDGSGYPQVVLTRADGVSQTKKVHRLVAEAFIPNPEAFPQINHKDGVKINNIESNLEWVTSCRNIEHSYETGLASNLGIRHPRAILDDALVVELRQLRASGLKYQEIADLKGLNMHTVWKAVQKKNWSHV